MIAFAAMWRSTWRFHWLLAGILVLEYALAFAIVVTTTAVLVSRMHAINQSSGIVERGLYVLRGRGEGQGVHRSDAIYARESLAALVGTSRVAMADDVPFGGMSALNVTIAVPGGAHEADPLHVDAYSGGIHLLSVLGLQLLGGRGFHADEIATRYGEPARATILSQTLAQRLFHDSNAAGKQVSINGQAATVVGVINPLAAPRYLAGNRTMYTLLLPQLPGANSLLLIQYDGPEARLQAVVDGLQRHDRDRIYWSLQPYHQIRSRYFESDNLIVDALACVIGIVLVTAICGILGLSHYWISRRRRQIAIRRALGATRSDILWHFSAESGLLAVVGMVLGAVLSFVFTAFLGQLHRGAGVLMWLMPAVAILLLAAVVVQVALRRWLRMHPVELLRTI